MSVFPSRTRELLTTRSWDFLGFPQEPLEELPLEGDVIVGMLDSGVWPDSPSFSDAGLGPRAGQVEGRLPQLHLQQVRFHISVRRVVPPMLVG